MSPLIRKATDLADTFISDSSDFVSLIPPISKAKTLYFLLKAGLAYVDIPFEKQSECNPSNLLIGLLEVNNADDLKELFERYNICLVSPLLYTRLAKDILFKASVNLNFLSMPSILGMMLESYIKGIGTLDGDSWNLSSFKIGENQNEIDLVDMRNGLLCGITISNKRLRDVHLNEHFSKHALIRVLATKDQEDTVQGICRIPYPRLCMMFDIGSVYRLQKTKVILDTDDLAKNSNMNCFDK